MTTPTKFSKRGHHPDYLLLVATCIITILGLVILASASSDIGKIRFNDSYYYLKHQMVNGLAIGLLGLAVAWFIRYQHYRRLSFIALLLNLGLLVLVFVPSFGIAGGGASRWVGVGPISFQPAELLKITYIIYLAAWLANPKMNRVKDMAQGFVPFLVISGVIAALLFAQPATSVVVILISAGLAIYFVSGAPWRYFFITIGAGLLGLALLVRFTPYRWERIQTFLHPTKDTQGAGYQINQATIAIGSGQLTGIGYGQSTSKINRLPAPLDDSIFAIAAQELGFIGAGGLVMLFGLIVFRLLWLARQLRDRFGSLLLIGFATIIAFQSIVNMGAISGLIPLTGVPLPFVSYGGTALAVFLTMIGISLNISKYT